MHASEVTPEAVERANELYWHSDRSVNQIAEDLDLSKGALYGVLEPQGSGFGCPLCGDEVGFANRTAKERESLECATCAWDGNLDETTSYVERGEAGAADDPVGAGLPADPHSGSEDRLSGDVTPPRPVISPPIGTIAGGALLGAAVGLALVMWARRR